MSNGVQTQVYVTGLDPLLGCFRSVEYGRPSLVLDLMEEFRPVLVDDRTRQRVAKLMNNYGERAGKASSSAASTTDSTSRCVHA
jgi:CRISPR/Cas system-associated endonuclease Cas1